MAEVLEGLPRGSYFLGKKDPAFASSRHCELLEAVCNGIRFTQCISANGPFFVLFNPAFPQDHFWA